MALITPTELRDHVETDLSDSALNAIIQAEEAEIIRRYGGHASVTETRLGDSALIVLARPAQSIMSVVENAGTANELALPPLGGVVSDSYLLASSVVIQRVGGDWAGSVTLTYTPVDETAQRKLVLINLCKLQLAFSGYSNQNDPGGGESPLSLTQERERLLRQLKPRQVLFA